MGRVSGPTGRICWESGSRNVDLGRVSVVGQVGKSDGGLGIYHFVLLYVIDSGKVPSF